MSLPSEGAIGVLSYGIRRIEHLSTFLGEPVAPVHPWRGAAVALSGVAAWGRRPSARRAQAFAQWRGIDRFLCLEDGFLRSLRPGASSPTCSLVVDDRGIYYDASQPSRLEAMIGMPLLPAEQARARQLIERWRSAGISKYNHAPAPSSLPAQPYVLLVDQTENDASVQFGQADGDSFRRMLESALKTYPDCRIVVKEHPEVALGRKRGYLGRILDLGRAAQVERVERLQGDAHVVPLIRSARAVFAVTSQVGFEALLHGKTVYTFGMPFYAGWGLTIDALPAPGRRHPVSMEQLAFAALVRYARYVQPHTGERCEVEDAIEYLALQRRMCQQFPRYLHAIGFSRWKRKILKDFLQGHAVTFHRNLRTVPQGATLLRWGQCLDVALRDDLAVITVEDGFLRSVGLGAQLARPLSWVFDCSGIYYDATRESDLERLLANVDFDAGMLERAARLRASIIRGGLTKYNVGSGNWSRPAGVGRVMLVVGQVEADASLRFGAPGIRTNRALLEAVRAEEPDAYLVYKPHPDVMSGLRGDRDEERALAVLCDEVVPDCPMDRLIGAVDGVHVLTSLAGFEALLRGKPVTAHGAPFYAGWGLTDDRCQIPRRGRRLSLDMLVAGALILYPRYVLRDGKNGFATPEIVVDHILSWREESPAGVSGFRRHLIRLLLPPWIRWRDAAVRRVEGALRRNNNPLHHKDRS
ncbi:Capsule polysaccharide transport protein [Cupriavidus taiwanensis]|uniref:capsular polysaccharide biosynthesis protein n=1 Tax=Cupriavidus taiwanensis TaxID=164546 RepID=UPI000E18BD90|nr:capsular polysaccharide biosynthesis protein [Cupriavidus taiwanensis]SPA01459.1 Capsule polysaccharide transport protein [Cupriavidus taiwanensis]